MSIPKPHYPAFSKDIIVRKAARAAPRLVVPPCEEMSHALVDMVINRPIRLQAGAIAEVGRPAA